MKAQAALEFLMTYGWALLIILGALVALGYYGFGDVRGAIPSTCNFGSKFKCESSIAQSDQKFAFALTNFEKKDVIILNIKCIYPDDNVVTQEYAGAGVLLQGKTRFYSCPAQGDDVSGKQLFKVQVIYTYNEFDALPRSANGEIIAGVIEDTDIITDEWETDASFTLPAAGFCGDGGCNSGEKCGETGSDNECTEDCGICTIGDFCAGDSSCDTSNCGGSPTVCCEAGFDCCNNDADCPGVGETCINYVCLTDNGYTCAVDKDCESGYCGDIEAGGSVCCENDNAFCCATDSDCQSALVCDDTGSGETGRYSCTALQS